MNRLKIATFSTLLLASALTAQAKITVNGPGQSGASADRVVAILSINVPKG
jgi:hypothetical protein